MPDCIKLTQAQLRTLKQIYVENGYRFYSSRCDAIRCWGKISGALIKLGLIEKKYNEFFVTLSGEEFLKEYEKKCRQYGKRPTVQKYSGHEDCE